MHRLYYAMSLLIAPLLPLWLELRRYRGKEDAARMHERFGIASYSRPAGNLLWLHAASVGEANSVLHLIQGIRGKHPSLHVLLTTGTVTSARLMQARLPKGVMHQYAPVDTPAATERFMRHWRPDVALWVESELWPNMAAAADRWQCTMGIINGRMSEKSFRIWNRFPGMIRSMLGAFDMVFAQHETDAARFAALGARNISVPGNLKYDAPALACDEAQLMALRQMAGQRTCWLAASTHPGEEAQIEKAHAIISALKPDVLTLIAPRHPGRGAAIAAELGARHRVSLRSRGDAITPDTVFYIADTLGELGLFYRLCDIAFMGGSLVRHGGQNPLEPARLSCAIITGVHTHNFTAIYQEMEQAGACMRVRNAEDLAAQLAAILANPARRSAMQASAKNWVESKSGAAARLMEELEPVLSYRRRRT